MAAKTMNELWAAYEAHKVVGLKTAAETRRYWIAYIQPAFGGKRIDKINYAMVDFLHREMRATPFQANRVLTLMRAMFRYAQAVEWLPYGHNPAHFVKAHKEKKRRRFMTAVEAPRIANELTLKEFDQPVFCGVVWLLIFTGARRGELCKAKWSDLKGNVLTLEVHKTDKSGHDRVIVLPDFAMQKLDRLFPVEGRNPNGRMFPIVPDYVTQQWIYFRRRCGCPDLRLHDLRHTFGTYALEQGFTLAQIGEALGHTSLQTTKIYAEMTNQSRHRVAAHVSLDILHDMKIAEFEHNEIGPLL